MRSDSLIDDRRYTIGLLLVVANKMETLLDRELADFNVTAKQWFLAVTLENIFENPPTLKEAARVMGSSYQNVKQIALKLEEKGLLKLEKDVRDARVTRLCNTNKSAQFWAGTKTRGDRFIADIYRGINADELAINREMLEKLLANINSLDRD
ncbi:MAG: MarR family winged helix-turn-helix transcriptional regulator [Bacillota bacterium]